MLEDAAGVCSPGLGYTRDGCSLNIVLVHQPDDFAEREEVEAEQQTRLTGVRESLGMTTLARLQTCWSAGRSVSGISGTMSHSRPGPGADGGDL
jgi:hypothetical protein